ncbi:MAG: tetratricopeptide repeat protein [Ruminococcus sp.]|nr:tetratricopeptide repeat protein [Ruminococcus sp.]
MPVNEIISQLRGRLTEDSAENERFLRAEAEQFARERNYDGVEAVSQLMLELMPAERREEIVRLTHVDGKRLDEVYAEIDKHLHEHDSVAAKPLAERLYKKITVEYKENDRERFVSLRNPFEDNLYQLRYKTEKKLSRTPFDFATYIATYGYILTETGSPLDAIPVLKKAMEYNPLDVGPKFELAEVYKLLHNKKRMIETVQDILSVASSPMAIARAYDDMGYILTEFHEYEDAAAFYTASVMFAPNPAIPREMQHLADLKGSPIVRPTVEQIREVMDKYEIPFGPNDEVVHTASELAANYLIEKDYQNAVTSMKILYGLTRDEKIRDLIFKYDPKYAAGAPDPAEANRANITRTENPGTEE